MRAARETAYYGALFARLGVDPARLRFEDLASFPCTSKAALRAHPDRFIRQGGGRTATPYLRALTG